MVATVGPMPLFPSIDSLEPRSPNIVTCCPPSVIRVALPGQVLRSMKTKLFELYRNSDSSTLKDLLFDVFYVSVDRPLTNLQELGDLGVVVTLDQQAGHLTFTIRQ